MNKKKNHTTTIPTEFSARINAPASTTSVGRGCASSQPPGEIS